MMLHLTDFTPELQALLPETHALLVEAHFVVHPAVKAVVLGGSRGLRGGHRPDSDLDLTLLVGGADLPVEESARESTLRAILHTSLDQWRGLVELDTAVAFDHGASDGLRLFYARAYHQALMRDCGPDMFGMYKIQKGFTGYVPTAILDFRLVYPLLVIWQR
jgi:hypothetical protein